MEWNTVFCQYRCRYTYKIIRIIARVALNIIAITQTCIFFL